MSRLLRIVTTFTVVPALEAAVIVGSVQLSSISFDLLFAGLALPTAAVSYWLLSSAGLSTRSAAGGALFVTAVGDVAAVVIVVEYLSK